jgi:hypothetical protein
MRDITLVDGLPTRLLVKFEDADAAQGKNPRPPGSHAWADLKARAFASHYILLPPEGTNSNDPDTWLLGSRIRFDLHLHTRFYYLLENQHGENEYDWYRLRAQSWSSGDGSCSRLSLI